MNWEAAGAIGEMIGSFAVLITVIYLALQFRQIRSEIRLNSILGVNQLFNETSNTLMVSPELAKILVKAKVSYGSMEAWEKVMLNQYLSSLANSIETTHSHSVLGGLDFEQNLSQIEFFFSQPGAHEYWSESRAAYGQSEWKRLMDARSDATNGT